ncbi:phosphatase PAP2 family protein [Kaistia sp. MMO-174]|uniref:phosphatase PAP2 family protein n=1 Tax=Kaistia sp. MMO-174 TaxID=3081256 RepID=UPI001AC91A30|nr:phosphatase PAP2 family protein [Hyphomicrobiales bacterium]MBN9059163.1 phosphatase PAP2 family protein [Hyphomicrobiales bacterium]
MSVWRFRLSKRLSWPRENCAAIAERIRRVEQRPSIHAPVFQLSDILALVIISVGLILIVGLAFDGLSVQRARALPRAVYVVGDWLSYFGKSQWELVPAGVVVLVLISGRWKIVPPLVRAAWAEIGALAAYIFLAIAGSGIIVNIVKQFIGRGRPPTFDEYGALVLRPFEFAYSFQSFPSGHATTAGALIALGFLVVPRWRLGLLLLGLVIAGSRVVVAAHYPSDILAGLIFGYAFSLWLAGRFAAAGWGFARGSTGSITARTAAIRISFGSPARVAILFAGLLDALVGRRIWIAALKSIGDGSYDDARSRRHRPDEQ